MFLNDFEMFILFISIAIILSCFLIAMIFYWSTKSYFAKRKFQKEYDIQLPNNVSAKIHKAGYYINYYILIFPRWMYSNNDGTRNKRYKNNVLILNDCTLHFNKYILTTSSPFVMLDIVNKIREKYGDDIIEKNDEELKKYQYLQSKEYNFNKIFDLKTITTTFSEDPYKFEEYCANLYEKMNYKVAITPKTNDGGFDLYMTKDGQSFIAECKCYSIDNKIGRPYIQKIVGANQEVKASKMVFITTSDFTQEAVAYAQKVGVELINGERFVELTKRYLNKGEPEIDSECKWHLTENDLKNYYPKDAFDII